MQNLQMLAQSSGTGGEGGGVLLLVIECAVLTLILYGFWRVFTKAGQPGWFAIIPIFNLFILLKIVGRPWWWLILFIIPLVNIIVAAVVSMDVAKSFGKGIGFAIGLFFLSFIFYPILGLGKAEYQGPAAA